MDTINKIKTICLLISSILLISVGAQASGSMEAILKGVVIDRPQSTHLLLVRQGEDLRINAIHIPIVDGKFEYVLNFDHEEQFQLVFNDELQQGAWRPIPFFVEQGVIHFTLHPTDRHNRAADRFNENAIVGGKLNEKYQNYLAELQNKRVEIFNEINAKIEQMIENEPEIISDLDAIQESFFEEAMQGLNIWHLQYFKDNPTIVGYSILLSQVRNLIQGNRLSGETNDISPHTDLYRTIFAPKFPDHPYTERMENLLRGSAAVAGAPFADFTAVDLNGNPVKLSDRITGKRTVLNLWASWCGPCRRKGRELISIYEEFCDKGIVVIGVARETSISNAEAAIKTDGYPWENLVELNDVGQIWTKYGIGNAGGMIFLIDENGIIVASDPTIEEVRDFFLGR